MISCRLMKLSKNLKVVIQMNANKNKGNVHEELTASIAEIKEMVCAFRSRNKKP